MTSLLEGVRVIELGHVWAGPYCGQVLADLGADVVKVESRHQVDVHRRSGPFAGGVVGIDRSGVWNAQNRGKRACTINLRDPRGVVLVRRLVAGADAVLENFAPGVLARRGLGHATLAQDNPSLVTVSLCGYGWSGPWRDFPAYGPMMDAVSGLAVATADAAGTPRSVNGWFPDTTAALFGACVLLAMVRQARATGTGGHYEVAQLEAAAWLLPEMALIDTGAPGDWNDDQHVPIAQAFRTGDDGDVWVWLAVGDMDEWKTVLGVLDLDPAVRPGPDAVAAAIARMPRADLCDRLQARGVECVPVLDAADLVTDEHLAVRGAFVTVEHTEVGPMRTYGRVVHDRRAPASDAPLRPAPVMGEHNDEVLLEGLGVGRAEYEALVADGVIA